MASANPDPASSTLVEVPSEPMIWHGWGDPSHREPLSSTALRFLAAEIGPLDRSTPPVTLDEVELRPSGLRSRTAEVLGEIVGPEHVLDDRLTRVRHSGGKSYPDLLRRRLGDARDAPDVVVRPDSHDQVQALIDLAAQEGIAVVPFGGGTSVVGGVEPERGTFETAMTVDTSRMDRLVSVDEASLLATFEPGIRGPAAEAALRARGYSLGHFPQSHVYASIGGYVATRSAGQASTGHGRIDEKVHAVRMATPSGTLSVGRSPASAAGPDLRHLVVGSEGTLGIITEATLGIHPAPTTEVYEIVVARSFVDGAALLAELVQHHVAPDVCRLSDETETRVYNRQTTGVKGAALRGYLSLRNVEEPCFMVLGWDGTEESVGRRRKAVGRVLKDHDVLRLGQVPGRSWAAGRFEGPYLRDELMDRGAMVETLETATTWSNLHTLHQAVRSALTDTLTELGTPPLVLAHISHLYETGCSLYFTWIARQTPDDPMAQWRLTKAAASAAIIGAGGTITHHHAVGTDHRPYMRAEVSDLGVTVLRAVKDALDPRGIMNPGKLLP